MADSVADHNRWIRLITNPRNGARRRVLIRADQFVDLLDSDTSSDDAQSENNDDLDADSDASLPNVHEQPIPRHQPIESQQPVAREHLPLVIESESDSGSDLSYSEQIVIVRSPSHSPSRIRRPRSFSRFGPNGRGASNDASREAMREAASAECMNNRVERINGALLTALWRGPASHSRCAVCLGNFVSAQTSVATTPCMHMFCECCLTQWLMVSSQCPVCRHYVL